VYRAAGDVVGMLVPESEIATLHTLHELADHVTAVTLAALGAGPALTMIAPSPGAMETPSA